MSPAPDADPRRRATPPPPAPDVRGETRPAPPAPDPVPDGPAGDDADAVRSTASDGDDGETKALRSDLDEVGRARPERSFNVGATIGIVLTVAAVIFVVQNNRATDFEWLWLDFSLPLWVVLVGSLAVGALLVLAGLAVHHRRRRRIARRQEATGRLRRAIGGRGERDERGEARPA